MTAGEIRDIRGPVDIVPGWFLPAIVLAAAAVLGLAGYLLVRWWRRRRARPLPGPSPEEVALLRLERARRLIAPACAREFGAEVSEAIRLYVEARFAEPASQRTTEEILRDLARSRAPALAAHRDALSEFLAHCDLAKFARLPLAPAQMEQLHVSAERLVAALAEAAVGPPDAGRGAPAGPAPPPAAEAAT
jgi:hypothetical protein